MFSSDPLPEIQPWDPRAALLVLNISFENNSAFNYVRLKIHTLQIYGVVINATETTLRIKPALTFSAWDLCTDTERLFEQLSLEMDLVVLGTSWRGWVCVPGAQHVSPPRSLGRVPTAAPPLLVPVTHSRCLPGQRGTRGWGVHVPSLPVPPSPPLHPLVLNSDFIV